MYQDLRFFSRRERRYIDAALRYFKARGLNSSSDLGGLDKEIQSNLSFQVDDGDVILENLVKIGLLERSSFGVILSAEGRFHLRKKTFASRYFAFRVWIAEMKFWLGSIQFLLGGLSLWLFQYFYNLVQTIKNINIPFWDRFTSFLEYDFFSLMLESTKWIA